MLEITLANLCSANTPDTAELPKVRPMVLATVPAVDDVGSENPPMAGAAVVVVAAGAEVRASSTWTSWETTTLWASE